MVVVDLYSLLMGREFKPDQKAILLGLNNKVEGDTKSGFELDNEFDMDQYFAPKPHTPSGCSHFILCGW